jgi:hypothetical protein
LMVSGLVTSPKDLCKMLSGEANPMRILVKLALIFCSFFKDIIGVINFVNRCLINFSINQTAIIYFYSNVISKPKPRNS